MPRSAPRKQAVGKTSPGSSRSRNRPTGVGSSCGATSGKVKPTSTSKGSTSKSPAKKSSAAKNTRRISPTSCKNPSSKRTSNHELICDERTIATATTENTSSKELKTTTPVSDSKSDQQKISDNPLAKGDPKCKLSDLVPTQVFSSEEASAEVQITLTNNCLLSRKIKIPLDAFTDELPDIRNIDPNATDTRVLICEPILSSAGVVLSRAIHKKSLNSILKTGNTVQKLHSCGSSYELPSSDDIKEKTSSDDGEISNKEESDTNCESKGKFCNLKSSTNFQKKIYHKSSTNNKSAPLYVRKCSTNNKIAPTFNQKSSTNIRRVFEGAYDRKSSTNIRRILEGSCDRKSSTLIRQISCDRVSSTNIEKVAPCNRKPSTNFQIACDRKSSTNFQLPSSDRKSSTNIRKLTSTEHVAFNPNQRHPSCERKQSTDQRPKTVENKKKAGDCYGGKNKDLNRRLAVAYALLGSASSKSQNFVFEEKRRINQRQEKPKKNNQFVKLKANKSKYKRAIGAKSGNKEKTRRKTDSKKKKKIRRTLTVNKIRHSLGTNIKMKGTSKRLRRMSSRSGRSRSSSPRKQHPVVLATNCPPCPPEALNIATKAAYDAERAAVVATQAAEAAAAGAAAAMAVCNATGIEPFVSSSNSRCCSSVPSSHKDICIRMPKEAICYKYQ